MDDSTPVDHPFFEPLTSVPVKGWIAVIKFTVNHVNIVVVRGKTPNTGSNTSSGLGLRVKYR